MAYHTIFIIFFSFIFFLSKGVFSQELSTNKFDKTNPKSLEWGSDFLSGKGIYLRTTDRDFEISIHGYLQIDQRSFFGPTPNILMARRARPSIDGRLFRYFSFKYAPDLGQFRTNLVVDGFVDFSYWSQFRIMAGKFRLPVGLEMQQTTRDALFIERGLTMDLIPNRSTGIQFYGDLWENRLSYQFGVFAGMQDNTNTTDFDESHGYNFAARVMTHPFINQTDHWLKALDIGIGSMYGNTNGELSNFREPAQGIGGIYFFNYQDGTIAAGQNFTIVPQFHYIQGPFRAFGEYVFRTQNVQNIAVQRTLYYQAWQIAASYILTKDDTIFDSNRIPGGVIVKEIFNPFQGHWGAVEIKARYNALYVDSHAFPLFANPNQNASSAKGWAIGVNWYFTSQTKMMLDYQQVTFQGVGGKTLGNNGVEHLLMARLQYAF
ncbi:OprO/OprP family phosphate-selective porin [Candidatus Nitrosacidococcus tergens]|nr:porin [Candidatus Nitrosacidococcus tergens]